MTIQLRSKTKLIINLEDIYCYGEGILRVSERLTYPAIIITTKEGRILREGYDKPSDYDYDLGIINNWWFKKNGNN